MDFSRIESQRMQAIYEPTDMVKLTADLASVFRSTVEKAGLELIVETDPFDTPVYLDKEMFEKMIFNLLSNAFKFTLKGKIIISLKKMSNAAELRIADTGVGIPANEIPRMFERFHRIEQTQGRSYEGSGIGLALTYELVKLHGGSIAVESTLGKGSTFIIQIPLGMAHLPKDHLGKRETYKLGVLGAPFVAEATSWISNVRKNAALTLPNTTYSSHETEQNRNPRPTSSQKANILIVDDNMDMCKYLKSLLEVNWEIDLAHDGEMALSILQSKIPDLILSDVMMPKMNGTELLATVRKNAKSKLVPFILLSARAGEEARIDGLQSGADDYLVKPFSAKELMARVTTHLELGLLRRQLEEQVTQRTAELVKTYECLQAETQERLRVEKELGIQCARRALEAEERQKELAESVKTIRTVTERLNLALQYGKIGTWSWDLLTNKVTADDCLLSLYGVTNEHLESTYENFMALILREDRTRVQQAIEQTLKYGTPFEIEFHVTHQADNSVHILASRANVYRDANGKAERMIGVNWDVTQQKRSEEDRLLSAVIKASQAIKSEALFNQLTTIGQDWDTVKQEMVLGANQPTTPRRVSDLEQMKGLVEYRDVLDYTIYRRAVETIFPPKYYGINTKLMDKIEITEEGNHQFKSTGYTFIVYNRADVSTTSQSNCEIKIDAPGSRLLTSDIDTSIYVSGATGINGLDLKFAVPAVKDKGPDYNGRVRNQVIGNFYRLSETLHNMTSTESRDSNAYADTFTEDDKEYPKFNFTADNNPIINNHPFIQDPQFYMKYKRRKHHHEQAASIIPLLLALSADEWSKFKIKTIMQIRNSLKWNETDDQKESYLSITETDLNQIFKICEEMSQEAEQTLNHKIAQIKQERNVYWMHSPFSKSPERLALDMKISAMNTLYVDYLEKVTDINNEIINLKRLQEKHTITLNNLHAQLQVLKKKLEELSVPDNQQVLVEQQHTHLTQQIVSLENQLRDHLTQIADKLCEKQAMQIKANLFAHGAYISRSAIHHIIKGEFINKGHTSLSKQTVMGSALQQIGFRLLYADKLRRAGKAEEEIAYCCAKYGQRVFDLLFNDGEKLIRKTPYDNNEIDKQVVDSESNTLRILARLKANQTHVLFTREEYHLINSEMKIISQAKRIRNISELDKLKKTQQLLKERMSLINPEKYTNMDAISGVEISNFTRTTEKNLFISVAVKLIVAVYAAKLEFKQGRLWGDLAGSGSKHTFSPIFRVDVGTRDSKLTSSTQTAKGVDDPEALTLAKS